MCLIRKLRVSGCCRFWSRPINWWLPGHLLAIWRSTAKSQLINIQFRSSKDDHHRYIMYVRRLQGGWKLYTKQACRLQWKHSMTFSWFEKHTFNLELFLCLLTTCTESLEQWSSLPETYFLPSLTLHCAPAYSYTSWWFIQVCKHILYSQIYLLK